MTESGAPDKPVDGVGPSPSSGRRQAVVFGFAALFGLYVALAAANPMESSVHGDGYYTYLWARSLVFDGDLDFHEDYRLCPDPWSMARQPVGEDINHWNMGPALFWVPILAFDRLTHPATASPDPHRANGCLPPISQRAVYGSLLAGWLTMLLGFLTARRHFGAGSAFVGAAGVGVLTSLTYYATMMLSYGHAGSSFGAGLAVYTWDRYRDRPSAKGWALQGLALGVAMLMRSQNAILVLLPLGSWLAQAWRSPRPGALARHVGAGVLFAALMLVIFSPQLWFAWHTLGDPFAMSQGENFMRWDRPRMLGALFSANGLVPWAPVHVLVFAGLAALALRRRTRALGVGLLVVTLANTYVVAAVYDWWGAVGFPGRRFDTLAVPFMVGLAGFAHEVWRFSVRRRAAASLALVTAGAVVVLGFLNVSTSVGVAGALRTHLPLASPTHWAGVLGRSFGPVWKTLGNPLTWPASIPFAIEHGVHPRRWDVLGGPELFFHEYQTLLRNAGPSRIDFRADDSIHYVDGPSAGEAIETHGGQRGVILRPGSSRVLLPLHYGHVGRLELTVASLAPDEGRSAVGLTVNGVGIATAAVPAGRREVLAFTLPWGVTREGMNEAWIWVDGGSVVLSELELFDHEPSPHLQQEERNRSLRAWRRAHRGGFFFGGPERRRSPHGAERP